MYTSTIVAALLAAVPAVNAVGSAIVKNHCSTNVYLWSVDADTTGDMQTIQPGETYTEAYRQPSEGGVSIKMSHAQALWNPATNQQARITQFEYTLDGMIWYDISNINGNPFWRKGLDLIPSDSSCPTKTCPAGTELCTDAYNQPDDNEAVGACSGDADTVFVLCAGNDIAAASSVATAATFVPDSGVAAATPAVTTAVEAAATAAPNGAVYTTFVTQVITIAARDAAPTPAVQARDQASVDMHKRAAHRHHFHRHAADAE